MRFLSHKGVLAFLFSLLQISSSQQLSAQSIWLTRQPGKSISIEILKPIKDNTTLLTSTIFLSARLPLTEKLIFVGELPFTHFQTDFPNFESPSEDEIGNPYLGLELRKKGSPVFIETGLRLPLVNSESDAIRFGQLTDAERLEAFVPDAATLQAALNFLHDYKFGPSIRLRVGPNLLLRTGDGGFTLLTTGNTGDSELYLTFDGQLGINLGKVQLKGGLNGRLLVTDDGNFGRRTFLQLALDAACRVGRLRPGVHATIPVEDDIREVVKLILGVNMSVAL